MTLRKESLVIEIDHVQIAAPNGCESDARSFFGTLLGLEEIQKPERLRSRGGCWFRVGSRQLHIGVEDRFSATTKAHPAFATHDIIALSNDGIYYVNLNEDRLKLMLFDFRTHSTHPVLTLPRDPLIGYPSLSYSKANNAILFSTKEDPRSDLMMVWTKLR